MQQQAQMTSLKLIYIYWGLNTLITLHSNFLLL